MSDFPRNLTDDYGDWPGSERRGATDGPERVLIDGRDRIVLYGYVCDAEASYSYDDFALVSLDGVYYLLQTSGCSCPSPSETWEVVAHGTLDEVEAHIRAHEHSEEFGYGVTVRQFGEFLAMIATARGAAA